MVEKIGEIEIYQINENLNGLSLKEREKRVNEIFKKVYQGKEVKYFLNDKEIYALINSLTKSNITSRKHGGSTEEGKRGFKAKLNLVISNQFISVLNNAKYFKSKDHSKTFENKNHKKDDIWHYYKKKIIVNDILYEVVIDIKERNGRFIIYNMKLK